jgi:fructose-specific phosphotransferase system IIC component
MSGSSKILLGFILGGMMSVDMGGPFNKAAYVFGTASIAAGNYDIMAAVMIGGIFVFPVVGNAMMYLAALVIGTVVSTALLGLLKKKAA